MKRTNTARDYFKIWIVSIIIFIITLSALTSLEDTGSSINELIIVILLASVFIGTASFLLMFAKAITSPFKKKEIEKKAVFSETEENIKILKNSSFVIHDKKDINSKIADLLDNEIDDTIFQQKKKSIGSKSFWLIIILIIIASIFLFSDYDSSNQFTPDQQTDSQEENFARYLQLEDPKMKWINNTLYFSGTLKNLSNTHHMVDILIRLDFSKEEDSKNKFDTRYVTIEAVPKSGAFSFNEPVYINPPVKSWWWTWQIEYADGQK